MSMSGLLGEALSGAHKLSYKIVRRAGPHVFGVPASVARNWPHHY